jgi:hypothetical protein
MKKIPLMLVFLFAGYFGYSQLAFGIKSGANLATIKGSNVDPKYRVGWYVGGLMNISIYKKLFIQPELLFSAKGGGYYDNIGQINHLKSTIRLNYFTASVLFNYKFDCNTSLFLGPEVGYLVSAYNVLWGKQKFNVSDNYPVKFDVGVDVGLDYKLTKNVGIEIRYNYGFRNMFVTDATGTRIGWSYAGNRVFQLGAFYSF